MKKYIVYITGMIMLALGITFNTRSDLGVAAFSSFAFFLSKTTILTFGTVNTVIYLIFIIIQRLIEKKWSLPIVLEIPFSFIFGIVLDVCQFLLPELSSLMMLRVCILILGNTLCGVGVYMMMSQNFLLAPPDGLVLTLSKATHKPYSLMKNYFDISFASLTILCCIILHTPFYGIGVGTIFSAFFIGRVIKVCEHFNFQQYL